MAQQLLDHAQIGTAFEEVGRRAMPQPVRPHVGCAVDGGDGLMHDCAGLPDIEPTAPRAQQQRRSRLGGGQRGTPVGQPRRERLGRRLAERRGALFVALAQDAHQSMPGVDVVEVQAAQFADADAGGIEQLDDQPVPQGQRITLLRTGFRR